MCAWMRRREPQESRRILDRNDLWDPCGERTIARAMECDIGASGIVPKHYYLHVTVIMY